MIVRMVCDDPPQRGIRQWPLIEGRSAWWNICIKRACDGQNATSGMSLLPKEVPVFERGEIKAFTVSALEGG